METGPVPSTSGEPAAEGPRILVERPPPGLARGKYAWPAWGIGALGGLIVLLGLSFIVWRARRRRPDTARRDDARRPSS